VRPSATRRQRDSDQFTNGSAASRRPDRNAPRQRPGQFPDLRPCRLRVLLQRDEDSQHELDISDIIAPAVRERGRPARTELRLRRHLLPGYPPPALWCSALLGARRRPDLASSTSPAPVKLAKRSGSGVGSDGKPMSAAMVMAYAYHEGKPSVHGRSGTSRYEPGRTVHPERGHARRYRCSAVDGRMIPVRAGAAMSFAFSSSDSSPTAAPQQGARVRDRHVTSPAKTSPQRRCRHARPPRPPFESARGRHHRTARHPCAYGNAD